MVIRIMAFISGAIFGAGDCPFWLQHSEIWCGSLGHGRFGCALWSEVLGDSHRLMAVILYPRGSQQRTAVKAARDVCQKIGGRYSGLSPDGQNMTKRLQIRIAVQCGGSGGSATCIHLHSLAKTRLPGATIGRAFHKQIERSRLRDSPLPRPSPGGSATCQGGGGIIRRWFGWASANLSASFTGGDSAARRPYHLGAAARHELAEENI